MIGTVEILHRPEGWTTKVLFYHIEGVAERIGKSRREVDRMVEDGELTKVLVRGLSCIPAHELLNIALDPSDEDGADGDRGERSTARTTARPEAEAEHGPETTPPTPWEELNYEPR